MLSIMALFMLLFRRGLRGRFPRLLDLGEADDSDDDSDDEGESELLGLGELL